MITIRKSTARGHTQIDWLDSWHTLQMIKGKIDINHHELSAGDGAAIQDETSLSIHCRENAEFLFFDLS